MILIQLLLPTRIPEAAGTPDAMAALGDTRRELADVFDGLTARADWSAPAVGPVDDWPGCRFVMPVPGCA